MHNSAEAEDTVRARLEAEEAADPRTKAYQEWAAKPHPLMSAIKRAVWLMRSEHGNVLGDFAIALPREKYDALLAELPSFEARREPVEILTANGVTRVLVKDV